MKAGGGEGTHKRARDGGSRVISVQPLNLKGE